MEEYRILLMGISGSGKTELARTSIGEIFIEDERHWGDFIDKYSKQVLIESKPVQLTIYDMIGNDDCLIFIQNLYSEFQGFVIVYSIETSLYSEHLLGYYQEIKDRIYSEKGMKRPIVLVGNKSDLEAERKISKEEGEKSAREFWGCPFYEASAKTGHNVEEMLMDVAHQIHQMKLSKCSMLTGHKHAVYCAKVVLDNTLLIN